MKMFYFSRHDFDDSHERLDGAIVYDNGVFSHVRCLDAAGTPLDRAVVTQIPIGGGRPEWKIRLIAPSLLQQAIDLGDIVLVAEWGSSPTSCLERSDDREEPITRDEFEAIVRDAVAAYNRPCGRIADPDAHVL